MTKISNTIAYEIVNSPSANDYVIGTKTPESNKPTRNFSMQSISNFVLGGLSPEEGGVIAITQFAPTTSETSPSVVANALSPSYEVRRYELLFLNLNGHQYLLKTPNVTIGVGGVTLTDADFIDFPVNQGEDGRGIVSVELTSTVGLVDTYTITYTDETTSTFTVTNGSNGTNGTNGTNGANADMTRTSTTSLAIENLVNKTASYTASTNLGWVIGTRLRFANSSTNYMEGVVTAVSSTNVTIAVDNTSGTGTYASWNISIAGDKGDTEATVLGNGTTTEVSGTGTAEDPYVIEVVNLQKTITGNHTLTDEDDKHSVMIDNGATDITITVPTGLPNKFVCGFTQLGSGNVTFAQSSTTINNPTGLKIKGQYYSVCLEKFDNTTTFLLTGDTKS